MSRFEDERRFFTCGFRMTSCALDVILRPRPKDLRVPFDSGHVWKGQGVDRQYYVYIATNKGNTVLYTGVTNDLRRRMSEHKSKQIKGFASRYNVIKLVYCEALPSAEEAIAGEKRIKGWLRAKKIALIESVNPGWKDLSIDPESPEGKETSS